jgi:hypothetical protein
MPRLDPSEPPPTDRRRGPYETPYEVVRGYEAPRAPSRRATDRAPTVAPAGRGDRDIRTLLR